MKVLITGFPGMGKSRLAEELKSEGHKAYDPQSMKNYMHVQSRSTGENIKAPQSVPRGWYDDVGSFNWDPLRISKLLNTDEDIFICSMAHNQNTFLELFDKVFVLTLDQAELVNRLADRPGITIGKSNSELQDILNLHDHFEQSLLEKGALQINAAQTPSEITKQILTEMNIN